MLQSSPSRCSRHCLVQGSPAWHPGTAEHHEITCGQLRLVPGTKLIMGSVNSLDSDQNVLVARTPAGFNSMDYTADYFQQ